MDNIVDMLVGLLGDSVDAKMEDVHIALPGRVEKYDASTRKATIQLLIKRAHVDETGARVAQAIAPIPGVPVLFPGGGGGVLTFPIRRGDGVLVVWSEASLDKWLIHGGIVDPQDDRRHDLSDAIAIPGLRPFSDKAATDEDAVVLSMNDLQLRLTGSEIRAGGTEPLVTRREFMQHFHTAPVGGGPTTVPTPILGTAYLRGFIVLNLLLVLALVASAFLIGRAT